MAGALEQGLTLLTKWCGESPVKRVDAGADTFKKAHGRHAGSQDGDYTADVQLLREDRHL